MTITLTEKNSRHPHSRTTPWLAATAVLAALASPACTGDTGPQGPAGADGAEGPAGPVGGLDPELSTLDKAVAGLGGADAITALAGFRIEASGVRSLMNEGYTAGDTPSDSGLFDVTLSYDVAGDNLRLDHARTWLFFGGQTTLTEYVRGDLGYVDGLDNIFGLPSRDMLSDRMAAIRKQERLLNPQLIVRDVLATPSIAQEGGVRLLDGSIHELLVVDADPYPITLWVDATTGEIARATTVENDPLLRDSDVEVVYGRWQATAAGLWFPSEVFIALAGELVRTETRSSIEVNPAFESGLFDFPAAAAPDYDATLAARGEANHQYLHGFADSGLPQDGVQTFLMPIELAPGVFLLTGGSHNTLVVEQQNGIVVIEAPLYPARSEVILGWIEGQFPGKPISHVIATHHHMDHTGGLREFVARGVPVVLGQRSRSFFAGVFRAPSTVVPDTLAQSPVNATILPVAVDGSITLPDAQRPVTAYHIPTTHSDDMLIIHAGAPGQQVLFTSDMYSPGFDVQPRESHIELYDSIVTRGLAIATIAGGHGGTATLADLQALIGADQD